MCWIKCVRPKTIILALLLLLASFKIISWQGMHWLLPIFIVLWGSATMAFNDWCDRHHDIKKGKRLALEKETSYVVFFSILWLCTFFVAFAIWRLNAVYGYVSFSLIFMGLMYFATRKVFLVSALWVAMSSAMVVLYALNAQANVQNILLFLSTLTFMLAREFLEDIDDIYIDRGYKRTVALELGSYRTKHLATIIYTISYVVMWTMSAKALLAIPILITTIVLLISDQNQKMVKYLNDGMFGLLLLIWIFTGV